MATLRNALGIKTAAIAIVSTEISSVTNKEGIPYYVCALKEPIMVRCSMDPTLGQVEVDEVYVLETALDLDSWTGDAATGMSIPGWVADLSKGHNLIAIYQDKPIAAWVKDQRKSQGEERQSKLLARLELLKKK